MLTVALVACGGAEPPVPEGPAWTDFTVGDVSDVTTRFLDQAPFVPTDEERSDVVARCPRLSRGRAVKETDTFHLLTVEGDRLDNVFLMNAWLDDDKLAVAQHRMQDGALTTPVGCERCTLIFGITAGEGRAAACIGPGYSLTFDQGALTSP
jgi:hypothetical protein